MSDKVERLAVKEKVGYAMGDTASNLFWMTIIFYGAYFYTDVFGISAAAMGVMFFVARFWDAINDPMMGVIADRTNTRWGKFRPYLVWMVVPFAISGTLVFTTPDWADSNKLIYAYVTHILFGMIYTAINIPYSSLMGVMSPNSQERTNISSYRFVGAYTGGLIVSFAVTWMVKWLGRGNEQRGYMLTVASFAVIAVVLFLVAFFSTKERVKPQPQQKTKLVQDIDDIVTNVPWLVLFLIAIFTLAFVSIRNGSVMYYFKYYVGDQKLFGMNLSREAMVSGFFTTGAICNIVGTALLGGMSRRFANKPLYMALMGFSALCVLAYYLLRPQDTEVMFILQVLIAVTSAPTAAIIFAMYADAADYGEWKRGRRSTGLVFSASSLAQKMGWTIGGAIAGILLAAFGYKANMEQAPEALAGIKLLMSVVPAIGAVLATVLLVFYTLDEKKMKEIEKDLTARREGEEGAGMESIQKAERPGSLTGFAGVNIVVGIAALALVAWYGATVYSDTDVELRTMLVVVLGFGAVVALGLIAGAVGILQGKFWGRTLTIIYGIVSLILFLVSLPTQKLDQAVGLAGLLVILVYPIVVLAYIFSKPVAVYFDRLSLESMS